MHLYWLGETAIKIETKTPAHDEVAVLCDPYLSKTNELPRSLKTDIVLASHGHGGMMSLSGDPFIISHPGEYEVKDVMVYAHRTETTNDEERASLIFQIETEHLSLVHLGALKTPSLSEALIERLGAIDILMLPAGGSGYLTADQASHLISELEPRVVIPLNINPPGGKQPFDTVDKFLKLEGQKEKEWIPKLKISKRDLPADETHIALISKA